MITFIHIEKQTNLFYWALDIRLYLALDAEKKNHTGTWETFWGDGSVLLFELGMIVSPLIFKTH